MSDYIAHHGILGMKWGVRRYQNKDGSLTSAGKKKYGTVKNFRSVQTAKKTAAEQKQNYKQFVKENKLLRNNPNQRAKRFGTSLTNEFLDKYGKQIENKYDAIIKANKPYGKQLWKAINVSKKYGKNSSQYIKEKKLADQFKKEAEKAANDLKETYMINGKKFLKEKLGSYSNKENILETFYNDSKNTYRFYRMSQEKIKDLISSYPPDKDGTLLPADNKKLHNYN